MNFRAGPAEAEFSEAGADFLCGKGQLSGGFVSHASFRRLRPAAVPVSVRSPVAAAEHGAVPVSDRSPVTGAALIAFVAGCRADAASLHRCRGRSRLLRFLGGACYRDFWGRHPLSGVLVSGIGYRGSFSSASIACGVRSRPESGRRDRSARATARRVCRMLRLRRCGRSVPSTSVQPVGCSLSSRRHAAVSLSRAMRRRPQGRDGALRGAATHGACVAIRNSRRPRSERPSCVPGRIPTGAPCGLRGRGAPARRGLPGAVRSAAAMRRSASRSGRVRRSDRGKRSRRALASGCLGGDVRSEEPDAPQEVAGVALQRCARRAPARPPAKFRVRGSSRNRLRLSLAGVPAARQSPVGPYSRREVALFEQHGCERLTVSRRNGDRGAPEGGFPCGTCRPRSDGATASVSRPSPGASSRTGVGAGGLRCGRSAWCAHRRSRRAVRRRRG